MPALFHIFLGIPTALAFLIYGGACLGTSSMRREFERFGLPKLRKLIGVTQLLGAIAILLAPWLPLLGFIGSTGLALQMAAGVGVRIRIQDSWLQASQAGIFLVINILLSILYGRSL